MSQISRSSKYTELQGSNITCRVCRKRMLSPYTKKLCLIDKEVWGYCNVQFRIIEGWNPASFLK